MDNLPELSLYVHLPWCDKKCPYCDFNITTDSLNDSVRELFNALKNDLDESVPLINQRPFKSIYFGGCLLYTSPSPRDATLSRMPSSA